MISFYPQFLFLTDKQSSPDFNPWDSTSISLMFNCLTLYANDQKTIER